MLDISSKSFGNCVKYIGLTLFSFLTFFKSYSTSSNKLRTVSVFRFKFGSTNSGTVLDLFFFGADSFFNLPTDGFLTSKLFFFFGSDSFWVTLPSFFLLLSSKLFFLRFAYYQIYRKGLPQIHLTQKLKPSHQK